MIVRFNLHSGYTYYYTNWDGDMSGEYVPLAEYQDAINLINELGEKDVQNHLKIEKLQAQYRELGDSSNNAIQSLVKQRSELHALIQRVLDIEEDLNDDQVWNTFYGYVAAKSDELEQLLKDCQEVL